MDVTRPARWTRLAAAVLVLALTAAACGDDGGDASAPAEGASGVTAAPTTTETPRDGGILRFGQFGAPTGLDPGTQVGSGTVGGIEMTALYDVLMRYDRATQTYVPGTAESMTPNADFTVWTLKVRPGITFTDGTPYDAAAVKFAVDRVHKDGHSVAKGALVRLLDATAVVDRLTVTFTLKVGFAGFPSVLNTAAGFVYSPTAFAKAGSAQAFTLNPGDAGAGPFMVKSYKPGESLELVRNPNYYGGKVHLDGITFTLPSGPQAALTSLEAGTLDIAFTRDPDVLSRSKDRFDALVMPAFAGNMVNMNSGVKVACKAGKPEQLCTGVADNTLVATKTATSNPLVRKAVAAAINPDVVNQRVWNGTATVGSAPFAGAPSDPNVAGPKFDLGEAKRLVAEAKAGGWDGKIRLIATMDPAGAAWGTAIATQLEAAGMAVTIDAKPDTAALVNQVLVLRDFDLTTYAYGMNEEPARNYLKLVSAFEGATPQFGYTSPDMVQGLEKLRVASTPAQLEAAYRTIAEVWTRDVPALVIAEVPEATIMNKKVKGVTFVGSSNVSFSQAWIAG